jgi:hypothetical protein
VAEAPSYAAPLLGWSTRLQTLFIGFRGTQVLADMLTNVNALQTVDEKLGSSFHAGYQERAVAYTGLIEFLARRYKLVVCGHSLGYVGNT